MRRAAIVFLIQGAWFLACLSVLLASDPKPPLVAVQFLEYTNVSPDRVGALFRVKNEGPMEVHRAGQCYLACGVSSDLASIENLMSLWPVWKMGQQRPPHTGHEGTLLPHEEELVLISPPPDKPVWCVTFTFRRENTEWEKRYYQAWEKLFTVSAQLGLRHLVDEPQGLRPVFFTIHVHDIKNPFHTTPNEALQPTRPSLDVSNDL